MASSATPPAPLMCVQAALRATDATTATTSARAQVAALPHVVRAISDCLDCQFWTLRRACDANLLSLLPRLIKWGAADGVDPHFWRFQCGRGLVSAVQHDNLAMVEWLHDQCPSVLPYAAMIEAARLGNLAMLQWLVERHDDPPRLPEVLDAAVSAGQLETARWLDAQGYEFTREGFSGMLLGGHYDVLVLLFNNIPSYLDCDSLHLETNEVFESGDPRIPELFIHDEWYDICVDEGLLHALRKGHLTLAEWCCSIDDSLLGSNGGHGAMDAAASSGDLAVVQWCQERFPNGHCTTGAMDKAAANGHLELVQWLHANRTEGCTTQAMDGAASGGHMDVVLWLHEHRTEGCTTSAMDGAAQNGHLEMVQWLHEHRTEGCTTSAMNSAGIYGHLDVVEWLHANRTEDCTEQAMDGAAGMGHLDVVKWLHNHGERCTENAMREAVDEGHMDVVLYLHSIGSPEYNGCINIAARWGGPHFEIVQWLYATYPSYATKCHYITLPSYVMDMLTKHLQWDPYDESDEE